MADALATDGAPVVWRPDDAYTDGANVTRLMRRHGIDEVRALRERSLDSDWFWPALIEDLDLPFIEDFDQVVDAGDGPQHARWFVGGSLNLAAACAERWAEASPASTAITWDTERGERRTLSYEELDDLAGRAASVLEGIGVRSGDRVGLFMPMAPETAAALLACWKLGAVAVPIFSGFGSEAVARRLEDADARVLVTADGFPRRGAELGMKEIADDACDQAGCVERMICWRRLGRLDLPWNPGRDLDWAEAVAGAEARPGDSLESEHPALLIYTSGSTGKPKGALLTHAGLMTMVARDASYHVDLRPDDRLCWITDIGWIMGAWEIVAAGLRGASVCMLEGAPTAPGTDRIWSLVEREGITVLGIGPSLVRGLALAGAQPGPEQCTSLRVLAATGEPWTPDAYRWLFEGPGEGRRPIINISGGSEVGGCLLAPLPVEPLKACSLGGPALGMDVSVFGPDGNPLGPNQVGELVCRNPWPGMTKGLWKQGERFIETYWRRFPGVWLHGDWASFDQDEQWYLHGRSDDTLNIAGQRIGPAEVEGAIASDPTVVESAAVAVPHEVKGQAVWCFVVASSETPPDPEELAAKVAATVGKPFRPDRIVFVEDLPRTRSGKILRRVVRAVATDEDPGDLSSIDDAAAIEAVRRGLGAPP